MRSKRLLSRRLPSRRQHKRSNMGHITEQQPSQEAMKCSVRNTTVHSGHSTEVYPLKDEQQILAMQRYLLTTGKYRYRNFLYFVLGISYGRRAGDTVSLKWNDLLCECPDGDICGQYTIRFREGELSQITEQKTGKKAFVYCNADVRKAIKLYLDATGTIPVLDEYIFKSNKVGEDHILPDTMRKILKDAAKAIGFTRNFGTHSLRKTLGYRLFMATGNLSNVQILFGHSDCAITRRYIGLDEQMIGNFLDAVSGAVLPDDELTALTGVDCKVVSGVQVFTNTTSETMSTGATSETMSTGATSETMSTGATSETMSTGVSCDNLSHVANGRRPFTSSTSGVQVSTNSPVTNSAQASTSTSAPNIVPFPVSRQQFAPVDAYAPVDLGVVYSI